MSIFAYIRSGSSIAHASSPPVYLPSIATDAMIDGQLAHLSSCMPKFAVWEIRDSLRLLLLVNAYSRISRPPKSFSIAMRNRLQHRLNPFGRQSGGSRIVESGKGRSKQWRQKQYWLVGENAGSLGDVSPPARSMGGARNWKLFFSLWVLVNIPEIIAPIIGYISASDRRTN